MIIEMKKIKIATTPRGEMIIEKYDSRGTTRRGGMIID